MSEEHVSTASAKPSEDRRKPYEAPSLTVHGRLEQITRGSQTGTSENQGLTGSIV